MSKTKELIPLDEVLPKIRKQRLQKKLSLLSATGVLVFFHDRLTRILIRLPIGARLLTVSWFAVSLVACGLFAVGTWWGFIAGALTLYAAIILDLCDGEIARYRAMSMTPRTDLMTHISGMYLDRTFHLLVGPLWTLSLALGLYRATQQPWVFAAGVCLLLLFMERRCRGWLLTHLCQEFAPRVRALQESGELGDCLCGEKKTRFNSLIDTIELRIANGKRFNLLVFLGASVDALCVIVGRSTGHLVILTVFMTAGVFAFVVVVYRVTWAGSADNLMYKIGRLDNEEPPATKETE